MAKMLRRIWKKLARRLRGEPPRYPFIVNANRVAERGCRGYALLEYLPRAFLLAAGDPAFRRHQNLAQCRQIAGVLGEFGYVVDVGTRRDDRFRPNRPYELILSERLDWRGIDQAFRPDAVRVFLATSINHAVHNANLRRRHAALARRRACEVQIRRVYKEAAPALAGCAALTGFGNAVTVGAWRPLFAGPLYPFNNYGYPETAAPAEDAKDFAQARRHFLFFASRSQVQKGLDLLLEVFPRLPDLHLHICSQFQDEPDFCACYRKELFETPNIHPAGWITVNSPQYNDLVAQCAWVIHPTCSEGQPGSVVQCMHSGLMPLVTREAGIDCEGFGVTLGADSLDAIAEAVVEVAHCPPEWHRQRSQETRRIAETEYSEEAFVSRWRVILAEVLQRGAPG